MYTVGDRFIIMLTRQATFRDGVEQSMQGTRQQRA
jgi:hypothetical protein